MTGDPHRRPAGFRICRSGLLLGVLIYILDSGWMALLLLGEPSQPPTSEARVYRTGTIPCDHSGWRVAVCVLVLHRPTTATGEEVENGKLSGSQEPTHSGYVDVGKKLAGASYHRVIVSATIHVISVGAKRDDPECSTIDRHGGLSSPLARSE